MISAWHLLWIIPLASVFTVAALSLVKAGSDDEDIVAEESPPLDEDMNRHSGLLEDD